MSSTTKILCIFDGFGLLPDSPNNCIARAQMPNLRRLLGEYYWTTLRADGSDVGQEDGLVGNSEVGHMNIGGLKLIPQLSYQITHSSGDAFDQNSEIAPDQLYDPKKFLTKTWAENPSNTKVIHLIGLFSKGQIHSDLRHWAGSIEAAGKSGATQIIMHLISDGRDSDRQSLVEAWDYFIKTFHQQIKPYEKQIYLGSLGGRYFAMDRDNNWDRVAMGIMPMISYKAIDPTDQGDNRPLLKYFKDKYQVDLSKILEEYKDRFEKDNLIIQGKYNPSNFIFTTEDHLLFIDDDIEERQELGQLATDISWSLGLRTKKYYKREVYDEFLPPTTFYYLPLNTANRPFDSIMPNDTVWLINFRTDRMKQFAQMLCHINIELQLNLTILSNNSYGVKLETFLTPELEFDSIRNRFNNQPGYDYKPGQYYPIFKTQSVQGTLAETISSMNKTQLHIAETEKYNHVTYFLNGGADRKWPGEDWVVIPSNKVTSHAEKPEMKAIDVTDKILNEGLGTYDYIIVNYANPDMVGHTGDIKAGIKSMEFLDVQLGRLLELIEKDGHELILIADHGNIEVVGEHEEHSRNLIDTEHNPSPVPCIIVSRKLKLNNPDLEQNKLELIKRMQSLANKNLTKVDLELVKEVLDQSNQVNVTKEWLTQNQIPEASWPLWYSGSLLIGL